MSSDDMKPYNDAKNDREKKLFVGGLSLNTNADLLREYYGKWGEITDVVVMKDSRSQRSRCFGFVTFQDSASVDAAQSCRPHIIDGKEVDCKRAMPREETSPEVHASVTKIFVGTLKDDVTSEDLTEYFSKFGNVTEAQIVVSKDTNTPRGFGFVTFDDTDSVDKVILTRPHFIRGSKSNVRKALSREEMNKMKSKPPPTRFGRGEWGAQDSPYQQSGWDDRSYPEQPYSYNAYGYNGYNPHHSGNGWSSMTDGFGNYPQQGYAGGPVRGPIPNSHYSRPAPYAGNGWQR